MSKWIPRLHRFLACTKATVYYNLQNLQHALYSSPKHNSIKYILTSYATRRYTRRWFLKYVVYQYAILFLSNLQCKTSLIIAFKAHSGSFLSPILNNYTATHLQKKCKLFTIPETLQTLILGCQCCAKIGFSYVPII